MFFYTCIGPFIHIYICMHVHAHPLVLAHIFQYMHIMVIRNVHFYNQHALLTKDAIWPIMSCFFPFFTVLNAQAICKRREHFHSLKVMSPLTFDTHG